MSAGVGLADPVQPGVTAPPGQPGVTTPGQPGVTSPGGQPGVTTPSPQPGQAGVTGVVPDPPVLPARPMHPEPRQQQPETPAPTPPEAPQYAPETPAPQQSPQDQGPAPQPRRQQPQPAPAPTPKPAPQNDAPYAPIIPPAGKVRVGDFVTDKPDWMTPEQMHSINVWSAYEEWRIAKYWYDQGLTRDEADRRAATTVTGALTGGAVAGVAGAAVGTAVGAPVGAVVGAIGGAIGGCFFPIPAPGPHQPAQCAAFSGPGAAIGAGAGAAVGAGVGAALGGAVAGTAGALAGGWLGNTLGGGDPNANPAAPLLSGENDPNALGPEPFPNPEARAASQYFTGNAVAAANAQVAEMKKDPARKAELESAPARAAGAVEWLQANGGGGVVTAFQATGAGIDAWVRSLPGGHGIVDAAHATAKANLDPAIHAIGAAANQAATK